MKSMEKVSNVVDKKIKHLILTLAINGIIMLFLGVLIVWTDFMARIVLGLAIIIIAYVFLYGAYKVWHLKKIFDKYIKF